MSYDEYYTELIKFFHKSITIKDQDINSKIFNCLVNWYKANYEKNIIFYLNDNNQLPIINITKEIKRVCNLTDYQKLQEIYISEELNELNKISDEIFDLVKETCKNKTKIDEVYYFKMKDKINQLENKFPKIIIDKYNLIRSECILDLEYLINNGNVEKYSLRTYDYLESMK